MPEESKVKERFVSLRVLAPGSIRDALTNFLVEDTVRGVQLEGEWIVAFCHPKSELRECKKRLARYYRDLQQLHPGLAALEIIQEEVRAEDWAESWKAFFKPAVIGKRIVLKPSWEEYEPDPGQVVIEIDPGRAFGTGKHPSTALCIELLEEIIADLSTSRVRLEMSVLDVGTGSGILGLVAAKSGANKVRGIDIDPVAVEIAARNVKLNGVGNVMSVSSTPLEEVEESFDVVVANLSAELFNTMAEPLSRRVRSQGRLLVSGILAEQAEECLDLFQRFDFGLVENRAMEEWQALLLGSGR